MRTMSYQMEDINKEVLEKSFINYKKKQIECLVFKSVITETKKNTKKWKSVNSRLAHAEESTNLKTEQIRLSEEKN